MGKTEIISGAMHNRSKARDLERWLQSAIDRRGHPGIPLILQHEGEAFNIPGWAKGVHVERAAKAYSREMPFADRQFKHRVQWVLVATEERGH